uniref:Putative reverse transcriptase n=1 Tax=Panstrongylus lignarius TaxID=156445 RepID=A0A224XXF2_9HEMI
MTVRNKLLLYKNVIRSMLLYASFAWSRLTCASNIKKLQTIQNKLLRLTTLHQSYPLLHKTTSTQTVHNYINNRLLKLLSSLHCHTNPLCREIANYDRTLTYRHKRITNILS